MSGSINYLDLIKNPEKLAGLQTGPKKPQLQKEAIIPPNIAGAKKNEWQEMQKQQQQAAKSKGNNNSNKSSKSSKTNNDNQDDDDVVILDRNPSLGKYQQTRNASLKSSGTSTQEEITKRKVSNNPQKEVSKQNTLSFAQKEYSNKPNVFRAASEEGLSKQDKLRAKYSLKKESKEDYKKIFSKIVREYKDEENYYYDANKTKLSTIVVYALLVILIVMYYFDMIAAQTPKFCNTAVKEDTRSCLKCPDFAKCSKKVMKCNDGYIQKGYTCLLNPNLISSSNTFILEKIQQMQIENGNHICFDLEEGYDIPAISTVSFENLVKELTTRIADVKSVASQQKYLQEFLEDGNNQRVHSFSYDVKSQTLSTERIRLTVFCSIKEFLRVNFKLLLGSGVTLIFGVISVSLIRQNLRKQQIADEIYEELLLQLHQQGDKVINISYYKEGIVNKYKQEFNEGIWLKVDHRRFQEKKVTVYRDYDGLYWSLL